MVSLLQDCAKLRMLMAWLSTLGGAHSSLGETKTIHVGREEELEEERRREGGRSERKE